MTVAAFPLPASADFVVENHGTIFLIEGMNAHADRKLKESTQSEDWQWFGKALAVDQRMIGGLVEGLLLEGYTVE